MELMGTELMGTELMGTGTFLNKTINFPYNNTTYYLMIVYLTFTF